MTAAELLGLIAAALLLQLMVGIAVLVHRSRVAPVATRAAADPGTGVRLNSAWAGWRDFRVSQRVFEMQPGLNARSTCNLPTASHCLPSVRAST